MENINVLGHENVDLLEGRNRVIAKAVTSTENMPPFDNTGVDGYAVKAADTEGATESEPVFLKVLETIAA